MKKSAIRPFFLTLVLVLSMAGSGLARSFYQPDTTVEILTEPLTLETPVSKTVRVHAIPFERTNDQVIVGLAKSETGDLLGRLIFGASGKIQWTGPGASGFRFQASGLLVFPGSPLPVDILPVEQAIHSGEPIRFEFQRNAGGRNFLEILEITARPVKTADARSEGWLRHSTTDSCSYFLITMKNSRTGEVIVEQLWGSADTWWSYEQTPFRRSWRLR